MTDCSLSDLWILVDVPRFVWAKTSVPGLDNQTSASSAETRAGSYPAAFEIVGWSASAGFNSSERSDKSRLHHHFHYYFRTSTHPTISTTAGR